MAMFETFRAFPYLVALVTIKAVAGQQSTIAEIKSSKEFEATILQSEYIWLVGLQRSKQELQRLDDLLTGLVKFAHVPKALFPKVFKEHKDFDGADFVIFPYGSKKTKISKNRNAGDNKEAVEVLTKVTPDITIKLPSDVDETNSHLREFFQRLFLTRPVKFPVIFFTESEKLPIEIRALALKYSDLFQFGVIHKPKKSAQKAYGISKLPHFSGYVIEDVTRQPRLKKYQYQGRLDGPLEYPFLVNFLYLLHKRHYRELPKPDYKRHDGDVSNNASGDVEIDLEEAFEEDLKLFADLFKMFPMEEGKTEL